MATVIDFEQRAVASLRARMAAVEEDNRDLVAFAQGHAGAADAIHAAALELIDAETIGDLVDIVTRLWPLTLGIDAVALTVRSSAGAIHARAGGYRLVEPRLINHILAGLPPVTLRDTARGHPLFGADAEAIRAEALVVIDAPGIFGLLALGQREPQGLEGEAGAALLRFLGQVIARMLSRCRTIQAIHS